MLQRNHYCCHDFKVLWARHVGLDRLIVYHSDVHHVFLYKVPAHSTPTLLKGGAAKYMGRSANSWSYEDLKDYLGAGDVPLDTDSKCTFKAYIPHIMHKESISGTECGTFALDIPLTTLVTKLSKPHLWQVAQCHHLTHIAKRKNTEFIVQELVDHKCISCDRHICIFSLSRKQKTPAVRCQEYRERKRTKADVHTFPPSPASKDLIESIVGGCATECSDFLESACAVADSWCLKTYYFPLPMKILTGHYSSQITVLPEKNVESSVVPFVIYRALSFFQTVSIFQVADHA